MGNKASHKFEDDKRAGRYTCGSIVVRHGEMASVFKSDGSQQILTGPCSKRLFFSDVQFLARWACDEEHYLVIEYLNGRKEHKRGPAALFMDPCTHKSIQVEKAIMLEGSECVVVYTENVSYGKGDSSLSNVTRRVVKGPEIFIPGANEWLHKYSWHGTAVPGKSKGSITGYPGDTKVAHAVEFTKLRQLPDQMYYTVQDLRTSDDGLLTLHIMIFFELVDIETMLDTTNDPISDIINAANADVMTYGACRTYEGLLAESSGLSDNASYPLLMSRMETIGYRLNKVVYRGYQTSKALQTMQETAISSRTKLRLEADTQRQEQVNTTTMLMAKEEQAQHRFRQEEREQAHRARMLQLTAEQEIATQKAKNALKLEHECEVTRAQNALKLEHERNMNNERKEFLNSLAKMQVDLTKYLVAQVSSKPTSHYLIENQGGVGSAPNLHLK